MTDMKYAAYDGLCVVNHANEATKMCVWPDGTKCEYSDVEEYLSFMSDDYQVVLV